MWLPPLLALPLIFYNLTAYKLIELPGAGWAEPIGGIAFFSGAVWGPTYSDLLLIFALALLFIEIARAMLGVTTSRRDIGLSGLLFAAYLVEFVLVPEAATSLFFACMAMSFMDVLAGYLVARRQIRGSSS